MIELRTIILCLFVLAIVGCSSHVTRPDGYDVLRPDVKALQEVTVEMSSAAKLQLSENIKFDIDALAKVLQRTLESRDLIAPEGDYKLKVVVNDIRVRSTFSAVMWGFMAGNDHVRGDVILQNLKNEEVYRFSASAAYALGGFGGGQDSARMEWLYEEFSKVIADELAQKREREGR